MEQTYNYNFASVRRFLKQTNGYSRCGIQAVIKNCEEPEFVKDKKGE